MDAPKAKMAESALNKDLAPVPAPAPASDEMSGRRSAMNNELDNVAVQLDRLTRAIQDLQHGALTPIEASELLGPAEIKQLTGAPAVPGQVRWLEQRAIPHKVEFIGATTRRRIIVSRVHVREWLAGSAKPAGGGLNWTSVR